MVLGVNLRSQVRRGKFGLNQFLIYNPFPALAQFFLFDHLQLINQKNLLGKKYWNHLALFAPTSLAFPGISQNI
jgi:hypothetical protein